MINDHNMTRVYDIMTTSVNSFLGIQAQGKAAMPLSPAYC